MNNNVNETNFDNEWNSVSTSEYAKIYDENAKIDKDIEIEAQNTKPQNNSPKQLLITYQLIACIIIALCGFIIKSIGGDLYDISRKWYYTQLNKSVIFDIGDKQIDLDKLFTVSTEDEA